LRAPAEVRLERFQRLMNRVSYESDRGGVIVVEGLKDRESLRRLGVKGRILCLQSSRRNTVGFAEELQGVHDVVVLTDFDREGVFLARRLARILNSHRIRTNLSLWQALRHLTRSDVRSIEELPKYNQRLQAESTGRLPAWGRAFDAPSFPRHRWLPEDKTSQSQSRRHRHR
jgi:5S rRNA maturation endonuclease (ribonuclease M5)